MATATAMKMVRAAQQQVREALTCTACGKLKGDVEFAVAFRGRGNGQGGSSVHRPTEFGKPADRCQCPPDEPVTGSVATSSDEHRISFDSLLGTFTCAECNLLCVVSPETGREGGHRTAGPADQTFEHVQDARERERLLAIWAACSHYDEAGSAELQHYRDTRLTRRAYNASDEARCEACGGSGERETNEGSDRFTPSMARVCGDCRGTGVAIVNCHGPCGEVIGFADEIGEQRYCSLNCEQADREPDDER